METKNEKTRDSEECDVRKPERLKRTSYVLMKRNNKCCTDETTGRRGRYPDKAGAEGKQGNNERKNATKMNKERKKVSVITATLTLPPLNSMNTSEAKHYRSK